MNGLLDWGGSNYPGETFLSPAPRSSPRAQRARAGEDAGGGAGLRLVPPRPSPPRCVGASRLSLRKPSSALATGRPGSGGAKARGAQDTEPQLEPLKGSGQGSREERGQNQGPLCCPRVVQTHCF